MGVPSPLKYTDALSVLLRVIEKHNNKINETASNTADFLLNENITMKFPFIILNIFVNNLKDCVEKAKF